MMTGGEVRGFVGTISSSALTLDMQRSASQADTWMIDGTRCMQCRFPQGMESACSLMIW